MTSFRALLALACLTVASPALAQTVDAPAGKLKGTTTGAINAYKGIPYAVPPVGNRRWQPPVPAPKWNGTRQATQFGAACIQPTSRGTSVYTPPKPLVTNEDCLTLNVWAPADARNAPVFFWIHGGALVGGSSSEPTYDGQKLAERGVIVVSINYRLGVLGWFAHPALSLESAQKISGNYGLLDQVTALRWVHQNIGAFGGDPGNVTIAGESAGGLSVLYLMASPAARGLFQKAIAQSAYMIAMPEVKNSVFGFPSGEAAGEMVQAGLQAKNLADLRNIDAQTITDKAAGMGFQPWGMVDGYVLPRQMVTAFDEGKQAPVPVLAGFNQGEIRSLMMLAPKPSASAEEYEATIRKNYGDLADAFLKLYPAADYKESILLTTRDSLYGWTAERLARKQAAIGQPAFMYMWDHGYPAMDGAGLHAFHASEIPYMFGTFDGVGAQWPKIPETAEEQGLSDAMIGYWTSFAMTGVPRAANAPDWPAFGAERNVMHFAAAPVPVKDFMPGMFQLNEEVMCRRKATGKVPWHWNVGLMSPPLPPKAAGC